LSLQRYPGYRHKQRKLHIFNVFYHPNFQSVDALVSDAGLSGVGGLATGFGDPSVTNTTYPGSNNSTRRITFYRVLRF